MHRYPIIINYINTANNMNMNNEKLRYFFLFRFACLFICLFTLPFIIMHMKTDQKLWKSYWMSIEHAYSFHLFLNLFLPSLSLFAWSLFLFRFDMNHLFQTKCLNWCFSVKEKFLLVDQFLLKWFRFALILLSFHLIQAEFRIHINIQNHSADIQNTQFHHFQLMFKITTIILGCFYFGWIILSSLWSDWYEKVIDLSAQSRRQLEARTDLDLLCLFV